MQNKINTSDKKSKLSRLTLGGQRVQTIFGLDVKVLGVLLACFIVPLIFLPMIFFGTIASENIKNEASLLLKSYSYSESDVGYYHLERDGKKVYLPEFSIQKTEKLNPSSVRSTLFLHSWAPIFLLLSIIVGGYFGIVLTKKTRAYFESHGDSDDEFVRGGKLITLEQYKENVISTTGASKYSFGGLPLPKDAEYLGLLILGAAGSGKSNELRPYMEQSFALGEKSIILDPSGSFTELYFRPGKDILLGPASQIRLKDGTIIKSVGWSMIKEVNTKTDGKLVSDAIIQTEEGAGRYWSVSAQSVVSNALVELRKKGKTKTKDLLDLFLEKNKDELLSLLEHTQASSLLGDLSTTAAKNIIQTITTELAGFELIKEGDFSVREFIRDQESDARIFIASQVAREALTPLYRVILTLGFNELSIMPAENIKQGCAFFLDEIASLKRLPTLATVLNEMRKYKAKLVAVSQTTKLILDVYGKEQGMNLLSSFQNIVIYRTQMEEEETLLAGLLGKQEVLRKNNNLSIAIQSNKDGMSENVQQIEQFIVHPSEFHLMRVGQAYLRFTGNNPVFLDNALNGYIESLNGSILSGRTSQANREYLVFDRLNNKIFEGVSDENGKFSIAIQSNFTSHKDFYLVVPPLVNRQNDGLNLELNPDLVLTIQSIEEREEQAIQEGENELKQEQKIAPQEQNFNNDLPF